MSTIYDRYFKCIPLSDAKAKMMQDIQNHILSGKEFNVLIRDLQKQGLLLNKPFTTKPKNEWNDEYLNYLESGYISDYFSKSYLEHFNEVAEYVYSRKRRKRLIVIIFVAVVLVAAIVLILLHFFKK